MMEKNGLGETDTRALQLLDAAVNLQQAGEFEQALQVLIKARDLAPEYAPVHLLTAMTYQNLGRLEEAEASLRLALKLKTPYPEALRALGLLLVSQQRFDEAIPFLKSHVEQEPDHVESLKILVSAMLKSGQQDEAIAYLHKAWESSHAEETGVQYGRLLIQLEELEKAEDVLRQVAELHPNARTLSELSLVLILQGNAQESVNVLLEATKHDPTFDRAWRGLAGSYDQLGQHDQALAAAEQALRLNRQHYRNWLAKAGVLLSLDRHSEAIETARHGIALIAPDDEEARPVLYQLVQIEITALLKSEAHESVEQVLDELCEKYQDATLTQWYLGFVFQDGHYARALQILEEAAEAGLEVSPILRYQVLHALGRAGEAWETVRRDLEDVPAEARRQRADAFSAVGVDFYVRGAIETSRVVFEQLLQADAQNPRVLNNLGFIALGERNLERAEPYLLKALEVAEPDWKTVVALNLGYLRLLQQDYTRAKEALTLAEAQATEEEESIPLIAYWRHGEVLPEYTPYPRVFYPTQLSIWANRVTLDLALGDLEAAATLAQRIVEAAPDLSLGYRVLGWALVAQSRLDAARAAWEAALLYAQEDAEKQALQQWLAHLS